MKPPKVKQSSAAWYSLLLTFRVWQCNNCNL